MLLPYPAGGEASVWPTAGGRLEHWEYDEGRSFWKLESGATYEEPCATPGEWAERISTRTGMTRKLILAAFAAYAHRGLAPTRSRAFGGRGPAPRKDTAPPKA